jgi:cyclophilin family peptidyl-prolyl cis-trans isomerase
MSFEDDVPPIVIKMSSADAPVTALRFLMLADSKFYDGTTFYRYEANQFALGGSPGANVYAGADRFLRDEIGLPNQYGAISMSTRGRDAGDGQFFVNLADQPQFDHEYTVFAQVISSGDAISGGTLFDQFQEGLQIRTIRTSTCPGRSIR